MGKSEYRRELMRLLQLIFLFIAYSFISTPIQKFVSENFQSSVGMLVFGGVFFVIAIILAKFTA